MTEEWDTPAQRRRIENVLEGSTGSDGRVIGLELVKKGLRSELWRVCVEPKGGAPYAVLQKRFVSEPARGFTEWASLDFLRQVSLLAPAVPRFLGGDVEGRYFLMQDIQGARPLADVLNGGDFRATYMALRNTAMWTGWLNGATMRREGAYEAIRDTLPDAVRTARKAEADAWLVAQGGVADWFAALGIAPPASYARAVRAVASTYASPTGFLGFTHGDLAPSNVFVSADGGVHFVDFEFGGYRHALYDISAWYMLCPVPEPLAACMQTYYGAAIRGSCPAARDEERFNTAWATMCAYRGLAILASLPTSILDEDFVRVESWTARQAALAAMVRLHRVAAGQAKLAPIGEAAGLLEAAFRRRWPELGDPLPQWESLRKSGARL